MKKKPYSELNGLIVAKGETCSSMATQIGISPQAMSAKMTEIDFYGNGNRSYWAHLAVITR